MDPERSQKPIADTVASLRALVKLPLAVTGEWQVQRSFVPQIGVGVLTIDPRKADPLKVLNQVEHMALLSAGSPGSQPGPGAVTLPAELC
jgi:hypothetical protein